MTGSAGAAPCSDAHEHEASRNSARGVTLSAVPAGPRRSLHVLGVTDLLWRADDSEFIFHRISIIRSECGHAVHAAI